VTVVIINAKSLLHVIIL